MNHRNLDIPRGEKALKSIADREKERGEEKPGPSEWQYFRLAALRSLVSAVFPYSLAFLTNERRPLTAGVFCGR